MSARDRRAASRPRIRAIAFAAGGAVVLVGALAVPRPPALQPPVGDPELVASAADWIDANPGARHALAIARVEDGTTTFAGFGADERREFEIGSITKTVTAALLSDAIERGEVTERTTLDELLPLAGTDAGEVTLGELATHSSGLPRLSTAPEMVVSAFAAQLSAGDPYRFSREQLMEQARSASTEGRGGFEYSNFGTALLGQALAAAAGMPYAELVEERIAGPLGLDDTVVPTGADSLAPDATTGFTATGRGADPWASAAYGPAGSIRSTAADLAAYARALLDGDAPGAAALDPRADAGDDDRVGFAWITSEIDGREITWHNGATGGFASMIALDREAGSAVVVLSDTAVPVDELAFELLTGSSRGSDGGDR